MGEIRRMKIDRPVCQQREAIRGVRLFRVIATCNNHVGNCAPDCLNNRPRTQRNGIYTLRFVNVLHYFSQRAIKTSVHSIRGGRKKGRKRGAVLKPVSLGKDHGLGRQSIELSLESLNGFQPCCFVSSELAA